MINTDFIDHLYNINEVTDDWIRNTTGIGPTGKYRNNFTDPFYDNNHKMRRIRSALFTNMAHRLKRETDRDNAEIDGRFTLNKRDPYTLASKDSDKITVTGISGIKNYGKFIHPNTKIDSAGLHKSYPLVKAAFRNPNKDDKKKNYYVDYFMQGVI